MTLAIMLLLTIQSSPVRCINPNKSGVVLIGTLKAHTFPGPPDWKSVARGDEPERYWLLHLNKPICVEGDDLGLKENNVSWVQLVFEDHKPYETYRSLLGGRVIVKGELFHRHTGHHHTRVLVTVQAIDKNQAYDRQKPPMSHASQSKSDNRHCTPKGV